MSIFAFQTTDEARIRRHGYDDKETGTRDTATLETATRRYGEYIQIINKMLCNKDKQKKIEM